MPAKIGPIIVGNDVVRLIQKKKKNKLEALNRLLAEAGKEPRRAVND